MWRLGMASPPALATHGHGGWPPRAGVGVGLGGDQRSPQPLSRMVRHRNLATAGWPRSWQGPVGGGPQRPGLPWRSWSSNRSDPAIWVLLADQAGRQGRKPPQPPGRQRAGGIVRATACKPSNRHYELLPSPTRSVSARQRAPAWRTWPACRPFVRPARLHQPACRPRRPMRRITFTSAAFALLCILLGGVAIAGAAPRSSPPTPTPRRSASTCSSATSSWSTWASRASAWATTRSSTTCCSPAASGSATSTTDRHACIGGSSPRSSTQ
jgi:hypothetical protein